MHNEKNFINDGDGWQQHNCDVSLSWVFASLLW
jgi:hypothetical protein